jgi:TfoX/Sxy family transcriptional regulator of competence genes
MAYDEELANRIREVVQGEGGLTEKRMFGGLAFLLAGHMAVAAGSKGGLMVRVDPARTEDLLADPRASRMVMGGREMDGWLRVDIDSRAADDDLGRWVGLGVDFVRALPPK